MKIAIEHRKTNIWIRLFFILLAIMPMGLALCNAIRYWLARNSEAKIEIAVVAAVFIGVIVWILFNRNKITKKKEVFFVVLVTLAGFALRRLTVDLLDTYPVSDPIMAYKAALRLAGGEELTNDMLGYYSIYPHWGCWAILISKWMTVFGTTLTAAQWLTVILSTSYIPLFYIAVKSICSSRKAAAIAMMFIAVSPGMVCSSGVLINDHMSGLFAVLFFLFLSLAYKQREKEHIGKSAVFYILAGLCIGFFHVFKLCGFLLLLAFFIGEMVTNILPSVWNWIKNRDWRSFLWKCSTSFIAFAILFLCYRSVYAVEKTEYAKSMGVAIDRGSGIYRNIYEGLNPEWGGKYSEEMIQLRSIMKENYPDEKERNEAYKELLLECLEDKEAVMNLLIYKFGAAWGDTDYSGEQALINLGLKYNPNASEDVMLRHTEGYSFIASTIKNISAAFWFLLMIFGTIGAVCLIFKRCNPVFLVSMIYLFGFALMLELMQVQGRYKWIVYFPLIMLASYGCVEVKNLGKWICVKAKNRRGEYTHDIV